MTRQLCHKTVYLSLSNKDSCKPSLWVLQEKPKKNPYHLIIIIIIIIINTIIIIIIILQCNAAMI